MAKLTVDGVEYEVQEGRTILQALDDLGVLMSDVEMLAEDISNLGTDRITYKPDSPELAPLMTALVVALGAIGTVAADQESRTTS